MIMYQLLTTVSSNNVTEIKQKDHNVNKQPQDNYESKLGNGTSTRYDSKYRIGKSIVSFKIFYTDIA